MKPSPEQLLGAVPAAGAELVRQHIDRLGDEYFQVFSPGEVGRHLEALARLSPAHPVEVILDSRGERRADCTVLAFDHPGAFSLITGTLAGMGFNIITGSVFTYAKASAAPPARRPARRPRATPAPDPLRRRRIIDCFAGLLPGETDPGPWKSELTERLRKVFGALEEGTEESRRGARHAVNECVAARLSRMGERACPVLYPVEIFIDNARGPCTTLRLVAQDTPAFLYAMGNALALQDIAIENVRIRTLGGRVEDEIDILDGRGRKIEDSARLDQLRLSVLLTKQFTYFLSGAPDPYQALARFEQMAQDVLRLPERGQWLDVLSNPRTLENLARILGASDLLWEDMIRLQYESLLPILAPHGGRGPGPAPFTSEALAAGLAGALEGARTYGQKRAAINAFKNRQLFTIDLDHILHAVGDVRRLSANLTRLAEAVVAAAVDAVVAEFTLRYGEPRTVGGLKAGLAVLGLGKMGGQALGYASDIELLFVFSDNGQTDGREPVSNSEFFGRVAEETGRFIESKREGIFHVDLRLRPHGRSGPAACSLESFCRYYGPGGAAMAYEKLALVRLRAVAGDPELGRKIERLRNEFIYTGHPPDTSELLHLRERQFQEKVPAGRLNAKFSPGALVDLEYFVQILQVRMGHKNPALRTPSIHRALEALAEAGVLEEGEGEPLSRAYDFLRRLINGLRMLRGNALDLFLPESESLEYAHLARRMGFERGGDLSPERMLHLEFEAHTAVVRRFIERHFGRQSLPDPEYGNVADLVLSPDVPATLVEKVLRGAGFANPDRAYVNLRRLAAAGDPRGFAWLAVLAFDVIGREADPDMALNNWERFVNELPGATAHFELLLSQPKRLEILVGLLAGSQFLADTLARHPDFWNWVTDPATLVSARSRQTMEADLRSMADRRGDTRAWMDAARRFRRREILRVGARDICLQAPLEDVTADLSRLAEVVTEVLLEKEWQTWRSKQGAAESPNPADAFCVIGLGKLGGGELNYSSDIDLLGVYDEKAAGGLPSPKATYAALLRGLVQALSTHTEEGYAYRVDLRLRPHGGSGDLVPPLQALMEYYRSEAELWEVQALLKARPVAGSAAVGRRFMAAIRPVLLLPREWPSIRSSVKAMRERTLDELVRKGVREDVKAGMGGIRDVEFLVQALQLRHAPEHPELLTGHTLEALDRLRDAGILPRDFAQALREDYAFLRRTEHYLQILEDRQIHVPPEDPRERLSLARRLLGQGATVALFDARLSESRARVRAAYEEILR